MVTEERDGLDLVLGASGSHFRELMRHAPFSVQMLSATGRTLWVNDAWSTLWGLTREQVEDYNMLEDAQLERLGVAPYIRRALNGEVVRIPAVPYDPEKTLPGRSRNADPMRWVGAIAYPFYRREALAAVVLIHEDVTAERRASAALRESEEKFRLLADTIPQLAWMARADGYIVWYNRRWYEYTGASPEQMEGWGWQSVHDPQVLPEVLEQWKNSIAQAAPFEMVFPLKGADGQYRIFLTRVDALRGEDGSVRAWFGTNTDISELKRMEEALRDADRRKDEFLATLAHELRNPLAPIRNALEVFKSPNLDPATAAEMRDRMERQLRQLVRLVDDLLDVARVMRNKVELEKDTVDVRTLFDRALETVQPMIEESGHELEIALPEAPFQIHADPVRLEQVVVNLLGNAAKYTGPGGRVRLSARREKEDVVIEVEDNGVGIAPEILPYVFDLFVQAGSSDARSRAGLGIGLTLVKDLVELHGGSVQARSDGPGKGSRFAVRIPFVEPVERDKAADDPIPETDPQYYRLLVVDDNEDAAESLAILLRMQGHDVMTAHDGPSALRVADSFRPALVLMDIGMPSMDGYEVARRIRATPELAGTVLVALTGWGQQEDRRRSIESGFDHHVVKPVDPLTLTQIVGGLAAGVRAPRDRTTRTRA